MRPTYGIWILEADEGARLNYRRILGPQHSLRFFSKIEAFLAALRGTLSEAWAKPDLLIAELYLPDGAFLESLEEIRRYLDPFPPFMIVSTNEKIEVLRRCFEKGALDYLTKPFAKNELLVKVERLLNGVSVLRNENNRSMKMEWGVEFDPTSLELKKEGQCSVRLTARELQIFTLLYRSEHHRASRKQIIRGVWGSAPIASKALDVHLLHLRRKLRKLELEIRYLPPDSYVIRFERTTGKAALYREPNFPERESSI